MKRKGLSYFIAAAAAVCLATGIQSCNKDDVNDTEKKVVLTSNLSLQIPVIMKIGETGNLTSFMSRFNMDSLVKSVDSKFDTLDIRSVKLKSCQLILDIDTTVDNFRNFHTCTIGISTNKIPSLTRIASATDIADTTDIYSLNIPRTYDVELNNIFMADTVYYRVYGNLRRTSSKPLGCKAIISYDVTLAR